MVEKNTENIHLVSICFQISAGQISADSSSTETLYCLIR